MQESFQAHTRQCISTTDPDKHCADRPHDRLDNVEVGDGEDDDVVNDELGGFVIPSAGVGPIAMPVTDSVSTGARELSKRWWYVHTLTRAE